MKKLILSLMVVSLFSGASFADSYMDCTLSGQTDHISNAPKRIALYEASGYYLREDGKSIKGFEVKETRNNVTVSYTAIKNGNVIKAKYSFDYTRCEDDSQGSASLTYSIIGSRGLKTFDLDDSSVSIYSCECGID